MRKIIVAVALVAVGFVLGVASGEEHVRAAPPFYGHAKQLVKPLNRWTAGGSFSLKINGELAAAGPASLILNSKDGKVSFTLSGDDLEDPIEVVVTFDGIKN